MKNFYDLPKFVQWIIAIALLAFGSFTALPIITQSYGLLLIPLLAPLINFLTTPFLRLIGYYKYLNPFVLSTVQTDKRYDLHNAFTFDYFVNFKWNDRGRKAQKVLLNHYFSALLTIIDRIENDELSSEVKIVGNSYFFNERTAEKLGFTISKASFFWVLNSMLQFIELSYLYSFSQGKISIPKFWDVKQVQISGSELVRKKDVLEKLVNRLLPTGGAINNLGTSL